MFISQKRNLFCWQICQDLKRPAARSWWVILIKNILLLSPDAKKLWPLSPVLCKNEHNLTIKHSTTLCTLSIPQPLFHSSLQLLKTPLASVEVGIKFLMKSFFATGILHLAKNQGLVEVQWYFKSFLQNLRNNCRLKNLSYDIWWRILESSPGMSFKFSRLFSNPDLESKQWKTNGLP